MYSGKKLDTNKSKLKLRKYNQEISRLEKKCRDYKSKIRRLKKKIDD